MAREFRAAFQRILWLSALALAFAVLGAWPMNAAKAQVIERGVQGGVVGAIIGGIVGGGRGAGTGAAIGAGVGIVTGAAEADANARAFTTASIMVRRLRRPADRTSSSTSRPRWRGSATIRARPTASMVNSTADAISQYQHANRLPVDGRPSPQLLNIMISQGG